MQKGTRMAIYLSMGSIGEHVRDLQQALNYLSLAQPPLVVDGIFGPKTKARVVEFQKEYNLAADGIVGPHTGGALIGTTIAAVVGSSYW